MNAEYIQSLIDGGYADEAAVAAEVELAGEKNVLCINGEVVSLVHGEPPQKIFRDSIDKLKNVVVKSGLFKKTPVSYTHHRAHET